MTVPNNLDVINLAGLNAADINLRRASDDLLIAIKATGDNLRVSTYFYEGGLSQYGFTVEQDQVQRRHDLELRSIARQPRHRNATCGTNH